MIYIILILAWLFVVAAANAYHHWRTACRLTRRNADHLAVIYRQRRRLALQDELIAEGRTVICAQDAAITTQAEHMAQQAEALRLMGKRARLASLSSYTGADYHYSDVWRN